MRAYAARFDASSLSCANAAAVVKHAAALEHMAATVKTLAAARAAEAETWKAGGFRSPEEELAQTTGTTVAGARDTLALGGRLADQPQVAAAARRGELSPTQASVIADAVAADPAAEETLVAAARQGGSVAELKNQAAQVKAGVIDREAQRDAVHRRRRFRNWTDANGESFLHGHGLPEDCAQIMAAIAARANQLFQQARREGRREPWEAYQFDALLELALDDSSTTDPAEPGDAAEPTDPTEPADAPEGRDTTGDKDADEHDIADPGDATDDDAKAAVASSLRQPGRHPRPRRSRRGAPVKLLVRVDLETLMRGFPVNGETCDLVGYGPISVSAVHKLLKDGDPFVAAILTKGKQLAGVAHLGRQPTAHQRSYLQWIYPTCAAQGCPATAEHLQIDHRIDWSLAHITLIDWLDALCRHHHDQKTRHGWSLVHGIGKRPFVPPSDARHPRHDHRSQGPP
jgi:hypothetical protein